MIAVIGLDRARYQAWLGKHDEIVVAFEKTHENLIERGMDHFHISDVMGRLAFEYQSSHVSAEHAQLLAEDLALLSKRRRIPREDRAEAYQSELEVEAERIAKMAAKLLPVGTKRS